MHLCLLQLKNANTYFSFFDEVFHLYLFSGVKAHFEVVLSLHYRDIFLIAFFIAYSTRSGQACGLLRRVVCLVKTEMEVIGALKLLFNVSLFFLSLLWIHFG